jgi:hypothetical protein
MFPLKKGIPSFWPSYIGENGGTLGKIYGIKMWSYWELLGNLMGTH